MEFGAIYTLDTTSEKVLREVEAFAEELGLTQTEGDDCLQYIYEGWENGFHRKLTGLLTKRELWEFAGEASCYPISPQERGPVLGAPGSDGFSQLPAIYFQGPSRLSVNGRPGHVAEIAVTPYPEMEHNDPWGLNEREVERLFEAVYSFFR